VAGSCAAGGPGLVVLMSRTGDEDLVISHPASTRARPGVWSAQKATGQSAEFLPPHMSSCFEEEQPGSCGADAARVASLRERPAFDNTGGRTYRSDPHAWSRQAGARAPSTGSPCSRRTVRSRRWDMAHGTFKVLDSDIHIIEPPDLWPRYIDPAFRDRAPSGLTEDVGDLRYPR
jgi:hypothetical protein